MVDNHGGNDLLDTTDCLEAVGVFKGWKNFLFLIVLLCLVLLQVSFHLVDRGFIKIEGSIYGGEPAVEPNEPAEPDEPAGPSASTRDAEPVIPALPAVINKPTEPSEPEEPGESVEPNEPAEPNELVTSSSALQWTEPRMQSMPSQLQYAGQWIPKDFFSKMTFRQVSWLIRFVNAVLILSAALYCLTLLFILKVSMNGRLGGVNHICRAFFLSLLMLVLLLPWQKVFGSAVTGVVFTPEELVKWYSSKTDDILDVVLYYLRFSGYGALMLLLLILSQVRGIRWAKAILRRLEII